MKFKNAEKPGEMILMLSHKEVVKFPFLSDNMVVATERMERTVGNGTYKIELGGKTLDVGVKIEMKGKSWVANVDVNGTPLTIEKPREIRKFDIIRQVAQRLPEFETA